MNKNILQTTTKIIFLLAISFIITPGVFAGLSLENIQFDPAIIAAGDEVDIVVQYRTTLSYGDEEKIDDSDYKFQVRLETDDDISKKYVSLVDGEGDDLYGTIYSGEVYNKRFRVKISQDAPAGSYEFKLVGQWYKNGEAETAQFYSKFFMPVKKEGIILGIVNLQTMPAEVRSGDEYIKIMARIENSGQKSAKAIEIQTVLPDGLEASYADNNQQWVGTLAAGEGKEVVFYVDVDEYLAPGVQELLFKLNYMDVDNNNYQAQKTLPFRVKSRPYLEVVSSVGAGLAGGNAQLAVHIKNTGLESAEGVEVRIIKQSAQPFTIDVRSDYLGELEPGEESVALFDIDISADAEQKEHSLKLLLRSKGDSDKGDDNIYTYTRQAKISVVGKKPNILLYVGVGILILIIGFFLLMGLSKKTTPLVRGGRK